MEKMLELKGDIIHSGVHPGIPNQQVPLWTSSNNIVFRDQSAKVSGAQVPLFDKFPGTVGPGTGVMALNNEGLPALVWGTRTRLYIGVAPPVSKDASRPAGYGGVIDDQWSFVQYGKVVLATNGVDEPQICPDFTITDPVFEDLYSYTGVVGLNADFRTHILRSAGAHIIAFNNEYTTEKINYEYRWCSEDDFLAWAPISTNSARDIQLRDLDSDIVAVVELGQVLVVFGRDQVHAVAYAGAPFFFPNQHLLSNIGAIGHGSVVPVGRMIYGMDTHGIYVLDGTSYQYVDSPSIHSYIFEQQLDTTRLGTVVAWADQNEEMVYFSIPVKSRPDGGFTLGFNYKSGAWSLFDWYRTAASSGGIWGHPIVLDETGRVWGQTSTAAGIVTSGSPLLMKDELHVQWAYGSHGYGEGGYGGHSEGIG